jgi:hypothetical protein
MNYTIDEFIQT